MSVTTEEVIKAYICARTCRHVALCDDGSNMPFCLINDWPTPDCCLDGEQPCPDYEPKATIYNWACCKFRIICNEPGWEQPEDCQYCPHFEKVEKLEDCLTFEDL